MAKTKKPLKTFVETVDVVPWEKMVETTKRANRYQYQMHIGDMHWSWLRPQIELITEKILENEDLPDKFHLTIILPRSVSDLRGIIYLNDARQLKEIKNTFRDSDVLRYFGISKDDRYKQSMTVSTKVTAEDNNTVHINATYKPKPKSMVIERNHVSVFNVELPLIVSAHTEIISKGHISTPGTKVKIESSIRVLIDSSSFRTLKYVIDLENRTIIERKSGDIKTFGNQDAFLDHLIEDLS